MRRSRARDLAVGGRAREKKHGKMRSSRPHNLGSTAPSLPSHGMQDNLTQLADTAKVSVALAHTGLKRIEALGPATLLSPAQVNQALTVPGMDVVDHWAVWSELRDCATPALVRPVGRVHGTLGVMWLGEGLPLVCATLTANDQIVRTGILVWSAMARDWLFDVLRHKRVHIILEGPDGRSALHSGEVELASRDLADLTDCEYSVADSDRGHALHAAALLLLAQKSASLTTKVRIVTESGADVSEMLGLQQARV